jgi:poly(3-hydroxybutyrate) depolymerase
MKLLEAAMFVALCGCVASAGEAPGPVLASHVDAAGRSGLYALIRPAPRPGESLGALVFFHADGAADRFEEWISPEMSQIASRHGLLLVSMREPDGGCWWAPHARADARYVADFIEHVLVAQHGVDRRRLYLAGKSGGAFFAAGVPVHADTPFGGGVIGLCGGDVPRLDGGDCASEADAPAWSAHEMPSHFSGLRYWFASTADEYVDYTLDAAQWFGRRGVDVSWRPLPGVEHCAFDVTAELARALEAIDR